MKKIVFDAEDHPPPSYYKESDGVARERSNNNNLKNNISNNLKNVVTSQPSSVIDKAEWWKAPEFVPKSFKADTAAVHQISENSINRLQPAVVEVSDKSRNVKIHQHPAQPINFPQPGFQLPMPTPVPAAGQIRPYPPAMFPLPGMPRPFFPPLPLLPPVQQFSPFHRQQLIRQPRPYPRNVTLNNTGIPSGYTANMTTINAGLGAQIPAIVIKKKRKKKSKKGKDVFSTSMYESDKVESISAEQKSKESSPDDKSTSTISQQDVGRSEPDLMSLHKSAPSSNFPADLDLIQSTANCAMLTGSWPDLSEPQRQMLHNSGMYNMYYDEQLDEALEYNGPDTLDVAEQIVYDSRLKQAALTQSLKECDENENEESAALLNTNHRNFVNHNGEKTLTQDGRAVIVHSTGDGTTSQLLPNQSAEGAVGFKGNRRRTFSLPDVPLVTSNASKVCCSIM